MSLSWARSIHSLFMSLWSETMRSAKSLTEGSSARDSASPAERHLEIVAADGLANVGAVHDRAGVPAGGYLGRRRWSGSEHHRRQHMGDRRHSPHKSSPFGGRPRPRVSRTARILGIGRPCGCDREHRDGEPCHGVPSRARPPGTSSSIPNTKRRNARAPRPAPVRPVRPLPHRPRGRRRRHGHRLPGRGRPPRPAGGAQGAPPRAGGGDRGRALPGRDQAHRQPPAPPHPPAVRLRRGGRLPVLRHAVREGRDAARPDEPRAAAPRRRRGPDHHRGGLGARLRPSPGRGPPRHQAREHPPARRLRHGGGLRDRARRQQGERPTDDRDRHVARHAALHEPRAGDGRARDHRPLRRVRAGRRALRDAHRRAALHRRHGAGGGGAGAHREPAAAHDPAAHHPPARGSGGAHRAREAARRPVRDGRRVRRRAQGQVVRLHRVAAGRGRPQPHRPARWRRRGPGVLVSALGAALAVAIGRGALGLAPAAARPGS